jgi:hypothetical protein
MVKSASHLCLLSHVRKRTFSNYTSTIIIIRERSSQGTSQCLWPRPPPLFPNHWIIGFNVHKNEILIPMG